MIRRSILTVAFVVSLAVAAGAMTPQEQAAQQVAEIEDIMQLVERGVSDEVIVKHIESRGFVFTLTDDDVAELQDRGVSEVVLDALLATSQPDDALEITEAPTVEDRFVMDDDDPDLYFYMSPGYFTPWYHYPYAWGFYYDPFPVYYSAYYYPFFYAGWGWYGHCNYWSSPYWPAWCSPGYYNDCVAYRGYPIAVPRNPASRWEAGRGMPARDVATSQTRTGESATRVRNPRTSSGEPIQRSGRPVTAPDRSAGNPATVHHPSRGSSRYESRFDRNRVRTSGATRRAESAVRPRGSNSASAVRPRGSNSAPTVRQSMQRTTPTVPRLDASRAPRIGQAPRSSSQRSASLSRLGAGSRSSSLSAARSTRFGGGMRSASWGGGGRASAPRAGGGPRGR